MMRIIKPKFSENLSEFCIEIDHIISVCNSAGFAISREDACTIWERHSENYNAGWLHLPISDDDLLIAIKNEARIVDDVL
jgi:hypothetical protein